MAEENHCRRQNPETWVLAPAPACFSVGYLSLTVSDLPTQGEVEAVVAKLNELLTNLRSE